MQHLANLINSSLSPLSHPIIVARWQLLLLTRNRKGNFPSCAFSFSLKIFTRNFPTDLAIIGSCANFHN